MLRTLVLGSSGRVRYSGQLSAAPKKLLEKIQKLGLEGIIAKNLEDRYEVGKRTGSWQKVKVRNEQEFVVGGYTPPKGSRDRFGAILVGFYENGKLKFASKVGSGFSQRLLEQLYKKFLPLKRSTCPFVDLPDKSRGRWSGGVTSAEMARCTWLDPTLVVEIQFSEWTRDERLRHPVFVALREDVKPSSVVMEKAS